MNVSKYLAVAAVAAGIVGSAFAEEEGPSVGAYAYSTLKNGYLSNGYVFYDDAVLQSGAGVTFAGFDLNVWSSYGVGSSYDRKHFGSCSASEVDYELDYYGDFEDFDYMLGVASWTYPCTDDTFDEWVGKIAVGYNAWVVRPELNARFGLESQQGCYSQFKLSKSFTLTEDEKLSLSVYGLVAYASKSYRAGKGVKDAETGTWKHKNVDKAGFVDTEFGAELGYAVSENFSVNCGCQLSAIIDSDLRDYCDDKQADGDKEHFMYYAGISLGF